MAKLDEQLLKVTILNEDDKSTFVALYNPKEISIDRSVPWNSHKSSKGDTHILEFTNGTPMTLSCELFFDSYEQKVSVTPLLEKLISLTKVAKSGKDEDKRPPKCKFAWGAFPIFKGVVESLSIKYTMFLPDGTPCRATASIKMKQASAVQAKVRKKKQEPAGRGGDPHA